MKLKIHKVISGPFFFEEEDIYYNLCLVEHPNGVMSEEEILANSFDSAYDMIKDLSTTIEPIIIDFNVREN